MSTHTIAMNLSGRSLIGEQSAQPRGSVFHAVNPATGEKLEPAFYSATSDDIDQAATLATDAFDHLATLSGQDRARLLRGIAENLLAEGLAIAERANVETGLPLPRLQSELRRTTRQLNLLADVLEEGSWVNARIDEADRDRKPIARPDIRSMFRPLGPVAVFGASNFPLAFSVAGGDTASALAAGNPVVVKAHPAHPGTSELVAQAIQKAAAATQIHPGIFSLVHGTSHDVGLRLVRHSAAKAVGFTGSRNAGKILMNMAAARPEPIPFYAEMSSTNPVFILPGALRENTGKIAAGLQTSFTVGSGQFCTKPGLVFIPGEQSADFDRTLEKNMDALEPFVMLTNGIASRY